MVLVFGLLTLSCFYLLTYCKYALHNLQGKFIATYYSFLVLQTERDSLIFDYLWCNIPDFWSEVGQTICAMAHAIHISISK